MEILCTMFANFWKSNYFKWKSLKCKITDSYERRVDSCSSPECVVDTGCAQVTGPLQLGHEPHLENPMCCCPDFPKGLWFTSTLTMELVLLSFNLRVDEGC